jgi:ribosomal protein S18 acetylase RimI-like enzyme
MLGAGFERVISKAYVEPAHDLSFEHVSFAVRGDTVVGMVSAHSSEQHRRSSDLPLKRAAGWRIVRLGAATVLVGRLLRFLDDIPDGDFYLQAVAVDPDSRGRGVGTVLFEHAQSLAMAGAANRLTLHVAVENTAARRLYERLGMHVDATSPKAAPLPGLQVHRMIKPL